jgi:PA-IL-like protein
MLRQRALIALLVATGLTATILATAERATYILTTGERMSGMVAFHTDAALNIIDGQFGIAHDNGKDDYVRVDQVALIDFGGAGPSQNELASLPENGNHFLVMRDGSTYQGKLINLVGGVTVRWDFGGGRVDERPIRDTARIYLNTTASRNIFNYVAGAGATPVPMPAAACAGGAASGGAATRRGGFGNGIPAGGTVFTVRGASAWTDTGMNVNRNDRLVFSANGAVCYSQNEPAVNPDGHLVQANQSYPVPSIGVGGLIAKIGNGRAFAIGSNTQPIMMPANGRLYLGINDDSFGDNSGGFRVSVSRASALFGFGF